MSVTGTDSFDAAARVTVHEFKGFTIPPCPGQPAL